MQFLEVIGKILIYGGSILFVVAVALLVAVLIWLAYEQANGRNPFL